MELKESENCTIGVVGGGQLAQMLVQAARKRNVEIVVQTSSRNNKETDITFTIKIEDLSKTLKLIKQNKKIMYRDLVVNKNVSKISIIGVGMITTPGVTYRMFQTLANKGINILVIATSEIKISVLIDKKNIKKALSALHKEFKLNS